MVVLMCAIAGRVNVPTFASHVGSPEILLGAVSPLIEATLIIVLRACYHDDYADVDVLRVQMGRKSRSCRNDRFDLSNLILIIVLFEVVNYGLSIAS
jgi:hypothetical protein